MELEVSLPPSQRRATSSYPEPDESSPHLPTLFSRNEELGGLYCLSYYALGPQACSDL